MLSTRDKVFAGFGASAFIGRRAPTGMLSVTRDRTAMRRELRAACPTLPGVYGMIDHADRLMYVGVSRRLRNRLVCYFQGADPLSERPRSREDGPRKELRISRRAVRLVWEVAGHELLALLREHELIRRFMPDLNVRGRRRRRLAYIFLSTDDAPRFRVAAQLPKSCRHHWGPFTHNHRLVSSVELLNRQFKLPDCPTQTVVQFADDRALFPIVDRPLCLRGEVDRCFAPCAAGVSRSDYFAQLARARAFLNGEDDLLLSELDAAMRQAVAQHQFEQAARLHEIRTDLESLRDRLLPRPYEEPRSFVYRVARGRRHAWLLIHGGNLLAVRSEPATPVAAERWLDRLASLPHAADWPLDDRDAAESRIIRAWFRQRPEELSSALTFDAASDFCRRFLSVA
jgi:excinuclease ABC subunit C